MTINLRPTIHLMISFIVWKSTIASVSKHQKGHEHQANLTSYMTFRLLRHKSYIARIICNPYYTDIKMVINTRPTMKPPLRNNITKRINGVDRSFCPLQKCFKTSVSCEASSKFHRTKLPKTKNSREASSKLDRTSFQNERFVRGFFQIDASDNFHKQFAFRDSFVPSTHRILREGSSSRSKMCVSLQRGTIVAPGNDHCRILCITSVLLASPLPHWNQQRPDCVVGAKDALRAAVETLLAADDPAK